MVKISATRNFHKNDEPCFSANHATGEHACGGRFRAVCWNIKFSRKIDEAIAELTGRPQLRDAGIMLLQEMDEAGVDSIARALKQNYVYYPASVQRRTGRKFGNAVLSRWPILASGKLLLPHQSPRTGESRIATRAVIGIGKGGGVEDSELLAYSVHTETFALEPERRYEQFQAIVDDIRNQENDRVLVGGDFNTIKQKDIRELDRSFAQAGIERVSSVAGPTLRAGFMEFTLDHIYARGLTAGAGGAIRGLDASDHFLLWQELALMN